MRLFAEQAFLGNRWAKDVLFEINTEGLILDCHFGPPPASPHEVADGPVIPGFANIHSHAFQRALAGLAERRSSQQDSFWTWREVMYAFLRHLTPEDCRAIAAQLYLDLLKCGFTSVGEFHYLHHQPDGSFYDPPTLMSDVLVEAAIETGIFLTLLPSLYQDSGFQRKPVEGHQKRFFHRTEDFMRLLESLRESHRDRNHISFGFAPHSLRAVRPEEIALVAAELRRHDAHTPIHIHVSEQKRESDECRQLTGLTPISYLQKHVELDKHWCLIHATHIVESEIHSVSQSGAVVGLCPTTEANLGDGLFPLPRFAEQNGHIGVGTDSHVNLSPFQELHFLEHPHRLGELTRCILASSEESCGRFLAGRVLQGGALALAQPCGSLLPGYRADLLVLDADDPALVGRQQDQILDTLVFSAVHPPVKDVMVCGRWVIRDGRHARQEEIQSRHSEAVRALLETA